MSSLNTPISTTVVALDVPGAAASAAPDLESAFGDIVRATALGLGYVSPDAMRFGLTLTLPPDRPIDGALRQLAAAIATFESRFEPLRVRAMLHHGVVFRSETGGAASYIGSAIRSAQSALSRSTAAGGVLATKDFSAFAANLPQLPIKFAAVPAGDTAAVQFTEPVVATPRPASGLPSSDADFIQFLKRRLAEDVGPFASPLVDNASRNVPSARELAASLSHEIDNPSARRRFETDVLAYIKARART